MATNLYVILNEIVGERIRQEKLKDAGKFEDTCASDRLSNFQKFAILGEEFGEVARAVCEQIPGNIEKRANLRKELIQTAAVCVAWIESL